jgi:hypothetical protein
LEKGKDGIGGKIKRESGRFLERAGSARTIEKLHRKNREPLTSYIDDSIEMSDSMFCGQFASKLAEPIRLGPWEFHGECRVKAWILIENWNQKGENGALFIILGERRENCKIVRIKNKLQKAMSKPLTVHAVSRSNIDFGL